ncbi:MAG TPA: ABC transporter ATP-binding protein [Armatimonadaceae bacterium]|nr:ABC transporter ATP-binding protein [Armatimonadaceae bacterium]
MTTRTKPLTLPEHDGDVGKLGCRNASLRYHDGARETYALRDVSVELAPGRFYGIMGPSGSGKSSLLYVLSGLKQPTSGSAYFGDFLYTRANEQQVTDLRRKRFGFVFQQPFLLPYLTALENIVVAAPRQDAAARDKAIGLLAHLGMEGLENKLPSQLSGGEKQRVSVVRAMMNDPEVIFADEPTASLDHGNGHRVIDALAQWRGRGMIVVVTHDPEMLEDADEILLLRDGSLAEVQERPGAGERSAEDAARPLETGILSRLAP